MPEKSSIEKILEHFEHTFTQLDKRQQTLNRRREEHKGNDAVQALVTKQQEELDYVRGELESRYEQFKTLL